MPYSSERQHPLNDSSLTEPDEERLHSQRLQAIGTLAGGVAHDFNNLLTVIIGYSEMLLTKVTDENSHHKIEEIRKASERAAALTRQLLAFTRRQVLAPVLLDLNEVLRDLGSILQRLIGEDIDLAILTNSSEAKVVADRIQIEQVIINLAVNARDAMPKGGKLTIEIQSVHLDRHYASQHISVMPGDYVMLAVTDTGVGMDAEMQKRIFEPFFTTKEQGHGTGLGLSTAYGIVKQSGGNIWVYSEPETGTSFKVYFPYSEQFVGETAKPPEYETAAQQAATILLVEDDPSIREVAEEILAMQGFRVLTAKSSHEALELFKKYEEEIDLLLTDVVMPGIGGAELVKRCLGGDRQMPVIYMSGYTDEAVVRHGILEKDVEFIQKPFSPDDLVQKIHRVLKKDRKQSS